MRRYIGKSVLIGALGACSLMGAGGNALASVRVGGWSLTSNGQVIPGFTYTGQCPVNLKFAWGLIGTAPGDVAYAFRRSDGAKSASQNVTLPRSNQSVPVYDEWQLGAPTPQFRNFKGWVELEVASPNPLSKKVNFTLHCN